MYAVYYVYNLFAEQCQQLIGIGIQDVEFSQLLSGFDNELFRINKEIWQLGNKARELGLENLFLATGDNKELYLKLKENDKGRKWLADYDNFIDRRGWRLEEFVNHASPSWIEQPWLALRDVKAMLAKGGEFTLDAERERLAKQREETEKKVLAKVPETQIEWFTTLMKLGQRCSVFSEEHNVYLDMPGECIQSHIYKEIGRRFAKAGVIDKQEDIWFLLHDEIRKAMISTWQINLRPYVEERKKEYERNLSIPFGTELKPPFLGDPSAVPELAWADPIIRVGGLPPLVRPELKADLYGCSSAPGVVEGTARVVMRAEHLDTIKPGEVLVCPTTDNIWTPAFGIITGVVTDVGGSLAHAGIVAREYGLPAVIGTHEGTRQIRTGDRIRVDGDMCAVYILTKRDAS